jgi:tetratricopeptide (TPR) repeat protein
MTCPGTVFRNVFCDSLHKVIVQRIILFFCLLASPAAFADAGRSDWNESFRIAKEQRRMVFVDYFATWCVPCRTMDTTVFNKAAVQEQLSDFVQLRIDVDRSTIARSHRVQAMPTYVIYDFDERELLRIEGAKPLEVFSPAIDLFRQAIPAFTKSADLFDAHKDLEASVLLGNTYGRLELFDQARAAYEQARKVAQKNNNAEGGQRAEVLRAFTFAREGNAGRTISLLQKLLSHPASRDVEAYIWLTIGNAYRLSKDSKSARDAYQHARSVAAPDTDVSREAKAAIDAMH